MGSQALTVIAITVGFVVVPQLAGAAPEAVNGLLLLMLLGALLLNSHVWLPYLAALGTAISAAPPAPTGGGGGGTVKAT